MNKEWPSYDQCWNPTTPFMNSGPVIGCSGNTETI